MDKIEKMIEGKEKLANAMKNNIENLDRLFQLFDEYSKVKSQIIDIVTKMRVNGQTAEDIFRLFD
jgi:archaellum component FlaC